jgi:Plasmid encoded RepA protein
MASEDQSGMRDTTDSDAEPRAAAQVDTAIRLYRDLGFSDERIAAQLARSGYAPNLIRERFPGLPEQLYPLPRSQRIRPRQSLAEPTRPEPVKAAAQYLPAVLDDARRQQSSRPVLTPRAADSAVTGGIAFQYVPLIQCSFPHADPGELRTFTRRNGWLELTLSTARPDTGLPYGVPARLLTIYCASEAIRTRSPEIFLGRSVHEFLRRLDVPITRGERGSLRIYANQLLRLIHCAVSIDENIRDASGRTGLHIRQALFAEEARLWWDEGAGVGQGSSFVLSPVLFQSILERSAPLSTLAIRQLRKSPMDLDVYAWLVHRLFHLSRASALSWEQLSGQFGHSYGEIRYFRRFFGDSLQRVLKVYPEAKVKPTETGLLLMPSRPHVVQRSSPERT